MRKNLYRKAGALWIGARRLGKDRFGYRNTRASLDQPEGTQRDIRYPSRLSNTQGFIIIHRDHQCHPSAAYRCFLKSTRNQQGSTYESASMADFVEYSWNCLHFPR
ncbi:hypothetical protein CEP52_001999 [Fusarium oligoseptatum]|uniref:Uncharacterized protein n=1 Tax=Fusarium oligoseptatum TaxID=2604345 RepID=A0A428UGD0_9HYPO|nr:hypothetical protein CEP52_001999 [Fusarium oligoseptatum]